MNGGQLVREARRRAGLSQRDLAERLGTTQPVVARWESGRSEPSFERVVDAIRAAGLDLAVRIVERDEEHALLVQENLRRSPVERLRRATEARAAVEDLASKVRRRNQADAF